MVGSAEIIIFEVCKSSTTVCCILEWQIEHVLLHLVLSESQEASM